MIKAKQYLMDNVRSYIPHGYVVMENEVEKPGGEQKVYFNILDPDQENRQVYIIVLTEQKYKGSLKTSYELNLYTTPTHEYFELGPSLIPSASAIFKPYLLKFDAFTSFFEGVQKTLPSKLA